MKIKTSNSIWNLIVTFMQYFAAIIIIAFFVYFYVTKGSVVEIKKLRETMNIIKEIRTLEFNMSNHESNLYNKIIATKSHDYSNEIKYISENNFSLNTPINSVMNIYLTDKSAIITLKDLSAFDCHWFIDEYKKEFLFKENKVANKNGMANETISCNNTNDNHELVIKKNLLY